MRPPLGWFGVPPDFPAWLAFGAACASLVVGWRWHQRVLTLLDRAGSRRVLWLVALLAGVLSLGYIAFYLRGGPRIIDATSYFLEARAIASGNPAFETPLPSGSFRGRFLLPAPDQRLAVIFPPGYPALLALGVVVGVPLAVGPLLAIAIVIATHALTRRVFESEAIALSAALLSALSAVLRYHTADTMSHGLSALLLCSTLIFALAGGTRGAGLAGLCAGLLLATRPVSGIVGIAAALFALRGSPRRAWPFLPGLVPGAALLTGYQWLATGSPLTSAQRAYYALADGPPGCFRYGFGSGVGCLVEHGDFVRGRLASGFGAWEALGTTARRLYWHLSDAANLELVWLLVPLAMIWGFRQRAVRLLGLTLVLLVALYAPFYFDGSYPGGGARFYADGLPLEHALIAFALHRVGGARFAAPAALFGFALHTSYDHRQLAERDGGKPLYDPNVARRAGVTRGLVFVTNDHAFNLGHDPGDRELVVARLRRDAHDVVLWQALGRPRGFVYDTAGAAPKLVPYALESGPRLRFEAEAEWPPLRVLNGWAHVDYPVEQCVSRRRSLRLRPIAGEASITLELATAEPGTYSVWLGYHLREAAAPLELSIGGLTARFNAEGAKGACGEHNVGSLPLERGRHEARLRVRGPGASVDYIELSKIGRR
jgi:hypothetical protein